jgi:hypothetical protein
MEGFEMDKREVLCVIVSMSDKEAVLRDLRASGFEFDFQSYWPDPNSMEVWVWASCEGIREAESILAPYV